MTAAAQQLVIEHAGLPRRLLRRTLRRVRKPEDRDDLLSVASVGLCEAAERYQSCSVPFAAFARLRILGAVKDWGRSNHMIPVKKWARESDGYNVPTSFLEEVAKRRHLRTWDAEEGIQGVRLVPEQEATQEDAAILNDLVMRSFYQLRHRERCLLVWTLMDQDQKDVAGVLDVTPSRVCQLMHSVRAAVAATVAAQ